MELIDNINDFLWTYILIALLIGGAIWFTIRTGGIQFTGIGRMVKLLFASGKKHDDPRDKHLGPKRTVSSFQAFAISLASRVGTGNIAGVAIAIAVGGPGAVFWMWMVAILGSVNAFVESTLAQLFKVKGEHSFRGGPAYYIEKGIGQRWYAVLFAVLITLTFALAYSSVQTNTISLAMRNAFGIPPVWSGAVCTVLTLAVIFGGVQRIAKVNEIVVPVMAVCYILLALWVVCTNIGRLPEILSLIVGNAFGLHQVMGGGVGMAVIMGVKRGLFSNEAGEGSTPNAAATAAVSHPVKQGLLQTLGVYTDTLIVCTATAFIILCSGIFDSGLTGIELTQKALETEIGNSASVFVAIAIVLFAFTSIIANYYYGETNVQFITQRQWPVTALRLAVGAIALLGALTTLELVWAVADVMMALLTLCNMVAILILGRYAILCLKDYRRQLHEGKDPEYCSATIPEIADKTEAWD